MGAEEIIKIFANYGVAIGGFIVLFIVFIIERYTTLKNMNENINEIVKAQKSQNSFLKMIARKLGIEVFNDNDSN